MLRSPCTLRYVKFLRYCSLRGNHSFDISNFRTPLCLSLFSNSSFPFCDFPLLCGVLDQIPLLCLCQLCVCLVPEFLWVLSLALALAVAVAAGPVCVFTAFFSTHTSGFLDALCSQQSVEVVAIREGVSCSIYTCRI